MESQHEALKAINNLVETCKDGERGYRAAAENVQNPRIRAELIRFADQRSHFCEELQNQAKALGAPAEETTSLGGAVMEAAGVVHRGWINLKASFTGHDTSAILNECENGETAALKNYETVMKNSEIPANLQTVIKKQHDEIEAAKNMVHSLKNTSE